MISKQQIDRFYEFLVRNGFLIVHDNYDCYIMSELITSMKKVFDKSLKEIIIAAGYNEILTPAFVHEDLYLGQKDNEEKYNSLKTPALLYLDGRRQKNAYLVAPSIDVFTMLLFEQSVHSYKNLPLKVFSETLSFSNSIANSYLIFFEHKKIELNCYFDPSELDYEKGAIDSLVGLIFRTFKIRIDKKMNCGETILFFNDGKHDVVVCKYNVLSDWQINRKGLLYTGARGNSIQPKCISCQISDALFWYFLAFHFDGDGFKIPFEYLPFEIVVLPVYSKQIAKLTLVEYVRRLEIFLQKHNIRFYTDYNQEECIGNKHYKWEKIGVPLRLEIGDKECKGKSLTMVNRYTRQRRVIDDPKLIIDELNNILKYWR